MAGTAGTKVDVQLPKHQKIARGKAHRANEIISVWQQADPILVVEDIGAAYSRRPLRSCWSCWSRGSLSTSRARVTNWSLWTSEAYWTLRSCWSHRPRRTGQIFTSYVLLIGDWLPRANQERLQPDFGC